MGGNNSNANRFPLPDNWNVTEYVCMMIPVPNDPQYIAIMRGLLDTLTWSRSFRLHPTENAARQVADTWAAAFASKQFTFEGCNMPDFRINDDTCLLEVNCSSDPEAPNWQPVFTPAYDPTEDAPQPALYPEPPPVGETNECLAAENVTAFMRHGSGQFATLIGDLLDPFSGEIAAFLYSLLSGLVAMVQANLWFTLLEVDWGSFNHATIVDDFNDFDWDDFKNLIVCYFSEDGSITPAAHLEALDEMESHAGQIWRLIRLVWSLAGSVGISLATRWAAITDGDCESCDPTFCHVFDFTATDGGFASTPAGISQWVSGQGWTIDAPVGGAGDWYYYVGITKSFAATLSLTEVRVNYTVTRGEMQAPNLDQIFINPTGSVETDPAVPSGAQQMEWIGALDGTSLGLNVVFANKASTGGDIGSGYVTSVEVCGLGSDPF